MGYEGGRWYTRNREVVEGAGLREAKKLLLYPSVTTIMFQLRDAYHLDLWKKEQIIMAALTSERQPDETDEAHMRRIMIEGQEESDAAKERGTAVHASIAKHLEEKPAPDLTHDLREFLDANLARHPDAAAETACVGLELGYAGTIDFWGKVNCSKLGMGTVALLDFKTQRVPADRKSPKWYDEFAYQLGGYAQILANDPAVPRELEPQSFISVVINTNDKREGYTPERPGYWVKEWDPAQIHRGAAVIRTLVDLFYLMNDKPRAPFPRPGTAQRQEMEAKLYGDTAAA